MFNIGDKVEFKDKEYLGVLKGDVGTILNFPCTSSTWAVHWERIYSSYIMRESQLALYTIADVGVEGNKEKASPKHYENIQDFLLLGCNFIIDGEKPQFIKWLDSANFIIIPFSDLSKHSLSYYMEKAKKNGWIE